MPVAEPPRVGYVLKQYPRYSETFVVTEILAHEAAGWEVAIFSLRPPNDGYFQDAIARVRAPVHQLPAYGLQGADFWAALEAAGAAVPGLWAALEAVRGEAARDVYQAVLLADAARRLGIGHLHAHFGTAATTVARLAARLAGLPYTFTAHAKDIFHASVRPGEVQGKLLDAAAVVTVSDYNLAYLRATYGAAAAGVRRIYSGLDLAQLPYAGPRDRPPRIVAVGRLVEKKGFADLIEACALLRGRGREFECQLIGAGELEADLRGRIERLDLQAQVEVLGPRPQQAVFRHVQGAAVLAAPCVVGADSNRDGLPTVLLEAMALGTPCVATDVTGIPEVVRDQETGLLVPQRDPAALAAALERLLADPALRVRLAGQARRLIEAEFDSRRTSADLRAIFRAAGQPGGQESGPGGRRAGGQRAPRRGSPGGLPTDPWPLAAGPAI